MYVCTGRTNVGMHNTNEVSEDNFSAIMVMCCFAGETQKFEWYGRMGYVHIDDVALCHILVYEHEEASGRYLCSSSVLDNNQLATILSARYPVLPIPTRFLFWVQNILILLQL